MRKPLNQAITDLMAQVRREHENEFAGDRYLRTSEILHLLGMEPGIDYEANPDEVVEPTGLLKQPAAIEAPTQLSLE